MRIWMAYPGSQTVCTREREDSPGMGIAVYQISLQVASEHCLMCHLVVLWLTRGVKKLLWMSKRMKTQTQCLEMLFGDAVNA